MADQNEQDECGVEQKKRAVGEHMGGNATSAFSPKGQPGMFL